RRAAGRRAVLADAQQRFDAFAPCSGADPGWCGLSELPAAVEQQRHGAVVDEFHVHVGLKRSGFADDPSRTQFVDEAGVEFARPFGTGGGNETRTTPLAAVAVERELADYQHSPADVAECEIHLPLGVFE